MMNTLFPIQQQEDTSLSRETDDVLFEEAHSPSGQSAQTSTRHFVGNIVERRRFRFGFLLLLIGCGILLFRSGDLQIRQGGTYRALAEENRMHTKVIPASRGVIVDRNGLTLAENVPAFDLITSRAELPEDATERTNILAEIAHLISIPLAEIETILAENKEDNAPVQIGEDISYDIAMRVLADPVTFRGINVEVRSKRKYATTAIPTLSHVLGYTGIISPEAYAAQTDHIYRSFDQIGKQGIEKQYEPVLRGTFGKEISEVDARGNIKRIVAKQDAVPGENISLTIDSELQAATESFIRTHLQGKNPTNVSVVVIDPRNGEILTLVSYPAFDANLFISGIDQASYDALINDPANPLFPRAVSGEYPSGSTIKPVYAAAALIEGIVTPSTSFLSVGGFWIGGHFFKDWRAGGHGVTNVYHAIADSVNTYFYIIGGGKDDFVGLGITRLMQYAALFGFGSQTGIDLPGEASGFLPTPAWKEETYSQPWYVGDTYNTSIGQGDFLVTPLQIAQSTSTFANGGSIVTPKLVAREEVPTRIIPEETAEIIQDAMRQTITNGSAQALQDLPIAAAGKTGTAQWNANKVPHSWFTGFAPFEDPTIVVTVLVEEGGNDYIAVPIAKDILKWWFAKYPKPESPQ